MDNLSWAVLAGVVILARIGVSLLSLFLSAPVPPRRPVMRNAGPDVIYRED